MGLFKKKSDPISERAAALNAEIAALESQIKKLSQTGDGAGEPSAPANLPRTTATATNSAPVTNEFLSQEIVFEKVEQKPLRAETTVTQEHYNEMGVRKFDLPGLFQKIRGYFQGKPSSNPKLVSYLAAGSVQGLRPLRYEKRVARNRFIALALFLFFLIWGIVAWVFTIDKVSSAMRPFVLPIETSHGTFVAHYTEKGLSGLDFPRARKVASTPADCPREIVEWHSLTTKALAAALHGKPLPALPPLEMAGSDFQKSVWAVMRKLKPGETISYGELAAKIGSPGAARAVGAACGANPIPVLIPCHRILAANGKLGGFSGGLDWKKKLLAIEEVGFELLQPLPRD